MSGNFISRARSHFAQGAEGPLASYAKNSIRFVQAGMLAAIFFYLAHRLSEIGWSSILENMPTNPLFYLITIAIFFTIPVFEIWAYRVILDQKTPRALSILSRKSVFNDALLSYSGEAYLCERLSNRTGIALKTAATAVKDSNIVSALISNSWTIILVLLVLLAGRSDVLKSLWATAPVAITVFGVICLSLYCFSATCLRFITKLKSDKLLKLAGIHTLKNLVLSSLQILQWVIAIPAESFQTWGVFLTIQILLKRIPFLPNTDLMFLGLGLSLSGFAATSANEVNSMLLAATAMMQLTYFFVFIITTSLEASYKAPKEVI